MFIDQLLDIALKSLDTVTKVLHNKHSLPSQQFHEIIATSV